VIKEYGRVLFYEDRALKMDQVESLYLKDDGLFGGHNERAFVFAKRETFLHILVKTSTRLNNLMLLLQTCNP